MNPYSLAAVLAVCLTAWGMVHYEFGPRWDEMARQSACEATRTLINQAVHFEHREHAR